MSDLTTTFTNIANAIRSKTGSSDTMTPSEMPNEIAEIETPMDSINITQNGTYEPSEGRGYNQVIVEVPEPTLITKTITENGTYTASSDNADGYSQVTVNIEGFKKKSIANTPTDIASFDDGTANPMPSLEISIVPVQSGSGDPSPSNVRPISGWSGANVEVSRENLFDKTKVTNNKYLTSTGEMEDNNSWRITDFMEVELPIIYKGISISGTAPYSCWYDENKDFIESFKQQTGINVIQVPSNARYIRFSVNSVDINNFSVAEGSTLSIPFHDNSDNPITVYGGTLNVTSGELRVTLANIASYNGETINEPWISSMDVYSAGATPTTGAQVVYPLATPQTYQLTPAQVTTLLGQNNIFADCGQILEGEYFVTL